MRTVISILAIIIIALASLQTTSSQEANVGNFDAVDVSAHPCDNVTQYLDVKGLIEPPYEVAWTYDLERAQVGHDLKSTRIYHQGYDETGKRQITFVVDCETGEVYDHVPSFTELGLKAADVEKMNIALNRNLPITQNHLDQIERTGAEVLGVACRIDSYATRTQIETIKGYEWAWITSPYDWAFTIPSDEKIRTIHLKSHFSQITPEKLDQVKQAGAKVLYSTCYINNIGCKIYASATDEQLEIIAGYGWVSNITPDGKILTYVRSNSSITSTQVDHVKQTGADVESFICWIFADATNSQRALIGPYDWVLQISSKSDIGVGGGGGATISPPSKQKAVLLANSIDRSLASDFTTFLDNNGIEEVHVNASNFDQYTLEKFIVILGGPDAPEGVGEIVREVLNESEQDHLKVKGSRRMYVMTNVWRSHGQVVMVIAGSNRYETQKAHEENREQAHLKILRK